MPTEHVPTRPVLPDAREASSERAQTDDSLRAEREKADEGLGDELSLHDETADAVIAKARARADAVLALARAKLDRRSPPAGGEAVAKQRAVADAVLVAEREKADATVLDERAAQLASLAVERKVTDRDLHSERERADDALATRDEFMALVAHDLRNLLHTMNGFAGLIATLAPEPGRGAEIHEHAARIQRSGRRMDRLIGDLVDIASSHTGALQVTRELADPAHIASEAVEALQPQARARQLSLSADIVGTTAPAPFDPARILQVLTNLISNAIKFTPAQGSVVVRVESVALELRFSVRDTGLGIPADKLEAIFERFVQVQEGDRRGHGLGLYISRCIVHGHGGRIWAESELGRGSTVTFALPIRVGGT